MDHSLTFARHFARLVGLLLAEGPVDEQKLALRALAVVARDGAVTLVARDWRLVVDGAPVPEALQGVPELAAQLIGHAVRELRVARGAGPAELLHAARALVAEPVPGDGGRALRARLTAAGEAVQVAIAADSDEPPPAGHAANRGVSHQRAAVEATDGAAPATVAATSARGLADELLARIDEARSPDAMMRALGELANFAEQAGRDGRSAAVADALAGLVRREAETRDVGARLAYTTTVRRLAAPTLLRHVAQVLSRRRDGAADYAAVLARAGEEGAEALVERLAAAESRSERRVYFDALARMPAAVPMLLHMLGDARWFVVRNAAELLGELRATEADGALAEALRHDEERVRRAAAGALARLDTPRAGAALRLALRDRAVQVREQAALGVTAAHGAPMVVVLGAALDAEEDAGVQRALLAALGRVGTSEAVQRLVAAAEPDGRLFRKKPLTLRVAAVEALTAVGGMAAREALERLAQDRDGAVREAAERGLVSYATQHPQSTRW